MSSRLLLDSYHRHEQRTPEAVPDVSLMQAHSRQRSHQGPRPKQQRSSGLPRRLPPEHVSSQKRHWRRGSKELSQHPRSAQPGVPRMTPRRGVARAGRYAWQLLRTNARAQECVPSDMNVPNKSPPKKPEPRAAKCATRPPLGVKSKRTLTSRGPPLGFPLVSTVVRKRRNPLGFRVLKIKIN